MSKKAKKAGKRAVATKKSTPTDFKEYCHIHKITQSKIHETMHLSYRTIHHLWNGGSKINKSTITLIYLSLRHTFGLKVTEQEVEKMLLPAPKTKK